MIGWPLLVLVIGCALAALSSGRWQLSIAAWLAPAFLLYFSRSQELPIALVGVFVALFAAAVVSNRGIMPLQGVAYVAAIAGLMVLALLPFALDRFLAPDLPGFVATLLFPASWTAVEFVGGRLGPFGSWNSVAYTQYGNLPLVQLASVTGIWGITFVVAWFGSAVSWAILDGLASSTVLLGLGAYFVVLSLLMLSGGFRLALARRPGIGVRVAAIEPTGRRIDPGELMAILASAPTTVGDHADARRTLANLHDLLLTTSEREILAGATIVVWPEAGAPVFAADEAALIERAGVLARDHGIQLLMGIATIHTGPPFRLENKAVLIDRSGEVAFAYLKTRPVPGWEAQVSVAGDGRIPVHGSPSGRLAAAICFDLDFPAFIRQVARSRADLLLAPASDWPEIGNLHHAMASFRAVENGVSLVRAARWGVSAVVDPYGRIAARTDHRSAGADAAVAFAPAEGLRTIYGRVGDAFAWLCVAATAGAVGWGFAHSVGII